jgi:hypothetical protein
MYDAIEVTNNKTLERSYSYHPNGIPMANYVMHVCMASYMTVGYEHVNHAFRVNVHF